MEKNNRKLAFYILGALLFLNFLAWVAVFGLAKPQFLEVHFFDVGQGDAIFIETPQNHQILIDGGPSPVILEKLGDKMPFYDRTIDLVILTHPDHDHIRGLIEVLRKYKIENILWTGVRKDIGEFQEWKDLIEKETANIFIAKAGQRIKASKLILHVLHPFENLENKELKNANNTSIITRAIYNQNSFLFTGDISKSIEKELVEKEIEINSDILKVAHHGSKSSSSDEFLAGVLPEVAIIQVGENNYGHPHSEVLERLENFGISVLRTDKVGDIKIISDGENLKYETAISNFQN
jgi:competence protein ComEC